MKATALYLVGLVLFGFAVPVEGSEVLAGRDLLRAVRQMQGRHSVPAYAQRTAKHLTAVADANAATAERTDRKLLKQTVADHLHQARHPKVRSPLIAVGKAEHKDIEKPPEVSVRKRLAHIIDLSSLTKDTPFSEALEILRNSVEPPLGFVVFWADLWENAYITPEAPINMQFLGVMQVGRALELLLKYSSNRLSEVGFVVEDGFIAIATKEFLRRNLLVNVTDIADLVGAPAGFSFEMDIGDAGRGSTSGGGRQTSSGGAGSRSSSSRY